MTQTANSPSPDVSLSPTKHSESFAANGDAEEKLEDDNEVEKEALNGKKSKNKKKNQSKKKKEKQAFEKWCSQTLAASKRAVGLSDDISDKDLHELPAKFAGYPFTGPLRPHLVTKQVKVPDHIQKPDYADSGYPTSEMIARRSGDGTIHVHTQEEIQAIRDVSKIGREVLDIGSRFLKAGVTGDEIDRIIHQAIVEREAYPSPLNYNKFPKSICVSVNEVICHGIPDCRIIEEGDIVNLDISVFKNGFHCDLNETYLIGKCDEESLNVVKTAFSCLQAACEMIRPGMMYRDVGPVISRVAAQNSCSVVKTYCGHGIGRLFHSPHSIPHYAKNKAVGIMRPGHIFTIEPMINSGSSWGDNLWPDDWTASTLNGKRSAQFEHTFLVTETGVEILTARKGASTNEMKWDVSAVQR